MIFLLLFIFDNAIFALHKTEFKKLAFKELKFHIFGLRTEQWFSFPKQDWNDRYRDLIDQICHDKTLDGETAVNIKMCQTFTGKSLN